MKLGILGGTFDPIHLGHLELARNARDQFSLDKILLIPAYDPPHKQNTPPMASAEDRCAMVRLAIKGEPLFEVSDIEIKRKGLSYTYDTITELEKLYPQATLYLILGRDAFQGLDAWHKAAEIKRKVRFLVAERETHCQTEPAGVSAGWIRMPLCPVAASGIRKAVAEGRGPEELVPQAVLGFIRDHHLYRKRNS